nr:hypothetical protein [Tanacetum cinerariifolium]
MANKSVFPNNVGNGTSHRESRPVWNNVQRINHQNKFAPIAVFTRSGRIPVTVAKPKAAASTSAAKLVNAVGPKQSVNFSNSRSTFHKSHPPIIRSFYNTTTHSRSNLTKEVNTVVSKEVSVVKGNGVTDVKASTGCVWRPKVNEIDQISKDNRQRNMYSLDLHNVVPSGDLTCLFAKASIDESNLWHKRLGQKGKQHKATSAMPTVISRWMVARVMAGVSDVDVLLGGIGSSPNGRGIIHNELFNSAKIDSSKG